MGVFDDRPLNDRLEGHEPVPEPDVLAWAAWIEGRRGVRDLQVALDALPDGGELSTVFLGIHHNLRMDGPPVLVETARFSRAGVPQVVRRYRTWAEAEAQHAQLLQEIRGRLFDGAAAIATVERLLRGEEDS